MKTIDLHSHTTASDGSLSPRALIRLAKSVGLSAIAITDHDTVSGIPDAMDEANRLGSIEVVPGIELSSYHYGDVHILGYGIDYTSSALDEDLRLLRDIRDRRNEKMLKKFADIGISISMDELRQESLGDSIGRPHFASILIRKGVVSDFYSAFDKYLSHSKGICYVEKEKVPPSDAIALIRKYGGFAVLAHPIFIHREVKKDIRAFLLELKGYGLSGLEVYHPEHSSKDMEFFRVLANDLGLCITGGSDFHGRLKPHISLGSGKSNNISVPYNLLVSLLSS